MPRRIRCSTGKSGFNTASRSLLTQTHTHRAKMIGLATAALRARMIDAEEYGEMVELLDCAKLWAEEELIDAEMRGLFDGAGDIG